MLGALGARVGRRCLLAFRRSLASTSGVQAAPSAGGMASSWDARPSGAPAAWARRGSSLGWHRATWNSRRAALPVPGVASVGGSWTWVPVCSCLYLSWSVNGDEMGCIPQGRWERLGLQGEPSRSGGLWAEGTWLQGLAGT